MSYTRRQFIYSAAMFGAGAALARPSEAEDASLRFLLVGDWGRNGEDHQSEVARQMGITAQTIDSHFTVSVGDNFYENGVTSIADPQWKSSFETVYTAPALQTPWKVILGDHDYRGNVQAQLDYAHGNPRWHMPARYYTETMRLPDGADAAFYYLDTSPFIKKYYGAHDYFGKVQVDGQDSQAQLDWLDRKLTASTAQWNIVIGHHPIYAAHAADVGHESPDQPDMIARLNPILQKHDVPVYICGHDHVLQAVKMGGTSYICTGAGSETYQVGPAIRGGFVSSAHGFMVARLSNRRFDYSLIDSQGNALYSQSISRV